MKVTVIEIRQHQSINILIKLNKFKDIINNLRISGTQKIQLAIANKFIDNDEEVQCIEKVIIQKSRLVMKQIKLKKNLLIHIKIDIK